MRPYVQRIGISVSQAVKPGPLQLRPFTSHESFLMNQHPDTPVIVAAQAARQADFQEARRGRACRRPACTPAARRAPACRPQG